MSQQKSYSSLTELISVCIKTHNEILEILYAAFNSFVAFYFSENRKTLLFYLKIICIHISTKTFFSVNNFSNLSSLS